MAPFPRAYPRRGEIYYVNFNPARGSEQAGHRPAVIVSNDTANQHSPVVIVAAITTSVPKRPYPFVIAVPDGVLQRASFVLCNQLNTIDKQRLERYWGAFPADRVAELDGGLSISLALR